MSNQPLNGLFLLIMKYLTLTVFCSKIKNIDYKKDYENEKYHGDKGKAD